MAQWWLRHTSALASMICLTGIFASAQSATIDWTNVHQTIDGFGASDAFNGEMSSTDENFYFGTGSGQLGLSILRVAVPAGATVIADGVSSVGNCSSVGSSCAGPVVGDMQAMVANGGVVFASPWAPPAIYTTNGSTICQAGAGSGALATASYANYATWLANYVKSLQSVAGINLYALSIQNEPNICQSYDSALWSAANMDTFIKNNLGPTLAANSLSTLVFMPENSAYSGISGTGATCAGDSSCASFVSGYDWHDYDASLSGNTVAADPVPTGWPAGKHYWETEASCGPGFGPSFCSTGFQNTIADALNWAAVIDQRIAGDGANAWLYWWFNGNAGDGQGLDDGAGTRAKRAYMMGQYGKFVRPGFSRIDATRSPQTGISISAYRNAGSRTLIIIATNYTGSAVSQVFNIANASPISSVVPTITSSTQNMATLSSASLSGNSFTYTLPAQSIVTFSGTLSGNAPSASTAGSAGSGFSFR